MRRGRDFSRFPQKSTLPPPDFNLSQPSIPLFICLLLHYPFHCSTTNHQQ
nr:MAG TPA: hypothetical protein [Caudoviricetes sp.]